MSETHFYMQELVNPLCFFHFILKVCIAILKVCIAILKVCIAISEDVHPKSKWNFMWA